jgi:metal-dependent hydrolase (beta-lactamase superfamily II)
MVDFELPQESLVLASSTDRRRIQPSDRISIDPLLDDQALAIETRMGLIVILGCSHSGLINTLEHVRKMSSIDEIFGVIGGTHRISSSKYSLYLAGVERTEREDPGLQAGDGSGVLPVKALL